MIFTRRARIRIFVNGISAKVAGGKSILSNFLKLLAETPGPETFYVLTPDNSEYQQYSSERIKLVEIPKRYKRRIFLPYFNSVVLPRLLARLKVDVVFNLADLIIPTKIRQIYLFDWSFAVYPETLAWQRMDFRSWLDRKMKLWFFKRYIGYPQLVIAQTETTKARLQKIYGLKNVEVVPNAVSFDSMQGGEEHDFALPANKRKLLYLAHYYPHKNIEIFIELAQKIKAQDLPFCLIVTIAEDQHAGARSFLNAVKAKDLADIIINVGPVSLKHVPTLYRQSDALLMPTLLESFSGAYVEAMFHQKLVLTSDYDFAHDVCGEAAFYFDPIDVESILSALELAFTDDSSRQLKISLGKQRLGELLNWKEAFTEYYKLL